MPKPDKSFGIKILVAVIFLGLFVTIVYVVNHQRKLADLSQWGNITVTYEKGRVLAVEDESLAKDENTGLQNGTQQLSVRILSGEQKGQVQSIKNYVSNYDNIIGKTGDAVVVRVTKSVDGTCDYTVFGYYRAPIIYGIIFLFLLLLCVIGRKRGIYSVIALVFSFLCIIVLYIPMIIDGYEPILSSMLIAVMVTIVTMILIGGFTRKALTAILGTVLGLAIAAAIAQIAGWIAHLNGFNTGDAESLVQLANRADIKVGGLVFGGIIISALGAVIDIAMSIASAVCEVYDSNPSADRKKLFSSGMNIGRDMMGTMANTLILAFTGSSLSTLLLITVNYVPYSQLVNSTWVGLEVIESVSGSIGVILTVPIISFIASRIIPWSRAGSSAGSVRKHSGKKRK